MKKFLLLTIFLFQTFFGLAITNVAVVSAAGLSDSEDIFVISSPAPDSTVNGQTPISIRAFDDDQEKISFFAKLFDRDTCYEKQIGRVTDESELKSNADENSIVDWNTFETSSSSSIADGNYCLQICVFLKNGGTPYSACNSRVVNIANNNSRPEFVDFPEKITAKENEEFSFQFKSEDADGDSITYRIKSGPDSVSIDTNTGLLTGKVENVDKNSDFETTVQITDSKGVSNEKTFNISISDTTEGGGEETVQVKLNILSPEEGFVQTNKFLKIEWSTENKDSVQNYKIEISQDLENWQTIAENISTNQNYYLADVSEFSDGEYYIRLTALVEGEQDISAVSNKFSISVKADSETEVENTIQIFDVTPGDSSVVLRSNFKEISGKFVAGEDATVDATSFEIKLDGKILENCDVNAETFLCPIEEIELGVHSVETKILDSNKVISELDWNFELVDSFPENEGTVENSSDISIFGKTVSRSLFIFILLICCIASILVLTPWLLYFLWNRSTKRKEKVVSSVEFEKTPRQPLVERNTYITPAQPDSYVYSPTESTEETVIAPVNYTNETVPEQSYSTSTVKLGDRKEAENTVVEENSLQQQVQSENLFNNDYTPLEDTNNVYTNTGGNEEKDEPIAEQNTADTKLIEPYTPNQFEEAQNSTVSLSQPYLDPNLNPENRVDSLATETNPTSSKPIGENETVNSDSTQIKNDDSKDEFVGSNVQYPMKPNTTVSEESDGNYVEPTVQN